MVWKAVLLAWVLTLTAWVFLIRSGVRLGLFERYPAIYSLVAAGVVSEISLGVVWAVWGNGSMVYFYGWFASCGLIGVLELAVLTGIYRQLGPRPGWPTWHLWAVSAALLVWAFADDSFADGVASYSAVWICIRSLNAVYAALGYFAAVTSIRMAICRDVELGWNLTGALLAISVPATFHTVVFVSYAFGLPVTYDEFVLWTLATTTAVWLILAAAMSEFSPPRARVRGEIQVPRPRVTGRGYEGTETGMEIESSALGGGVRGWTDSSAGGWPRARGAALTFGRGRGDGS